MPAPARLHQVAVLALPGVLALDFGIPVHAFGTWDGGPYAVTVCTEVPGPVRLEGAPALLVEHGLEALADADTIVVPGQARPVAPSERVRAALASGRGPRARMVSICTGAFVLAAAGLLDGRRATTHWQYAAALARDYPAVTVDPHVLYVDEGNVLTSAGVAAGIDLCLHIIAHRRRGRGRQPARAGARRGAAPHRRPGPVHRPPGAARAGWRARRAARVGAAPPRRAAHRSPAGPRGVPVPSHAHPAVPRRDRAAADALAAGRPHRPGPRTARSLRRAHGDRGPAVRAGHPRKPADPVQTPHRRPAQHVPEHIPPPARRPENPQLPRAGPAEADQAGSGCGISSRPGPRPGAPRPSRHQPPATGAAAGCRSRWRPWCSLRRQRWPGPRRRCRGGPRSGGR